MVDKIIHFRLTEEEELLGADYSEHNVYHPGVGVTRAVSVLKKHDPTVDYNLETVGKNKGHMDYLEKNYAADLVTKLELRNTPRPKMPSGRSRNY